LDENIIIKIKNIPSGLSSYYHIRYNIRTQEAGDTFWTEKYQANNAPIQNSSVYTTVTLQSYSISAERVVNVEVQSLVCHYETHNQTLQPPFDKFFEAKPITKTYVDSKSDWSNPQSISLSTNGATGIPTTIAPTTPKPTQTTTPTPTQDPAANLAQWAEQIGTVFSFNWQTVALGAMAIVIAGLVAGMFMLWRKVGNLTSEKQSA